MRKKQAKPRKIERKYRKYNEEALKLAFQSVKSKNVPISRAAKLFGVPRTTLRDRVAGRIDPQNFGHDTLFTREEEKKRVEHVQARALIGYGMSNVYLQKMAGVMAYELKKKNKNTPMSNMWLYAFLKRWGNDIASIKPRTLDTSRAKSSTPEVIKTYFDNLEKVLTENNLLQKPHRIFNLDETGLQPEHKPSNMIGDPNTKVQAITSPRSTTTTVIGCVNAIGTALPPFFIFKGKRWNPDLMKGACTGANGTMSDSGWSNSEILRKYLDEHFLPLVAPPSPEDPVLLIYDGHVSHKSPETIRWAREKGIILFVLPAHTSHLLQPLDVSVFGPFKRYYYSECSRYMYDHIGEVITRYEMCSLASKAFLKGFSPLNIQSGFKKTGIYPLDKTIIEKENLLPCESFREKNPILKAKVVKAGPEKVELFLKEKEEQIRQLAEKEKEPEKKMKVPNPSGRAITSEDYVSELNAYENNRQQIEKTKHNQQKGNKKQLEKKPESPKPSTSGMQIIRQNEDAASDSDMEIEFSDNEKCCVCKLYEPEGLQKLPYFKLVSWAKCGSCEHSVHLKFCTEERAIRRQSNFLCPHCRGN